MVFYAGHMHPSVRWTRGKQAPSFQGKTNVNDRFNFDTVAGRCVVIMFYGSADLRKSKESLRAICTDLRALFDDKRALFFGVSVDPKDPQKGVRDLIPGIRFFWDYDLAISKLFGATKPDQEPIDQGSLAFRSFTLVMDSRLRIYDYIPIESVEQHTNQLRESVLALIAEEEVAKEWINAPVLIAPNVFSRSFCERLISLYRQEGGSISGTMTVRNGKTVGKIDRSFKRRMDYKISDASIIKEYRSCLIENLFPQIKMAFNFAPTYIERYVVACYDGQEGGFFRAHRDNTTPGTAHRRFACTINLNAEDYTGGDLRFPEYSNRTYRAPTGGAVVFSGSILHEALPVTSGQRFATLPFIHDDQAEEIRRRNAGNISGEIIRV